MKTQLSTTNHPYKPLVKKIAYKAGRSKGKISVRHRGGRVKRLYRVIDFKREKLDVPARVLSIEYDPYRSCNIALICYRDGQKAYILAPDILKVGDEVLSSNQKIPLKIGNRMPLEFIPSGTLVYNIEFFPGQGGQLVRTAGGSAQVLATEGRFTQVKLPSTEVRLIPKRARATIGQLSNPEHGLTKLRKAGQARKRGKRPEVRGVAMAPVDHPHGGGEGRTGTGRHPKTKWGKPAQGKKTRKKHKQSDKYIIKRRKS